VLRGAEIAKGHPHSWCQATVTRLGGGGPGGGLGGSRPGSASDNLIGEGGEGGGGGAPGGMGGGASMGHLHPLAAAHGHVLAGRGGGTGGTGQGGAGGFGAAQHSLAPGLSLAAELGPGIGLGGRGEPCLPMSHGAAERWPNLGNGGTYGGGEGSEGGPLQPGQGGRRATSSPPQAGQQGLGGGGGVGGGGASTHRALPSRIAERLRMPLGSPPTAGAPGPGQLQGQGQQGQRGEASGHRSAARRHRGRAGAGGDEPLLDGAPASDATGSDQSHELLGGPSAGSGDGRRGGGGGGGGDRASGREGRGWEGAPAHEAELQPYPHPHPHPHPQQPRGPPGAAAVPPGLALLAAQLQRSPAAAAGPLAPSGYVRSPPGSGGGAAGVAAAGRAGPPGQRPPQPLLAPVVHASYYACGAQAGGADLLGHLELPAVAPPPGGSVELKELG
jgi:hypothetical protein